MTYSLIDEKNFKYLLLFLNSELRHKEIEYYQQHGSLIHNKGLYGVPPTPNIELIPASSWRIYQEWANNTFSKFIEICMIDEEEADSGIVYLLQEIKLRTSIELIYYIGLGKQERAKVFREKFIPIRRAYQKAASSIFRSRNKLIDALNETASVFKGLASVENFNTRELNEYFPDEMGIIQILDKAENDIKELINKRIRQSRLFPLMLLPIFEGFKIQKTPLEDQYSLIADLLIDLGYERQNKSKVIESVAKWELSLIKEELIRAK
jgi:hypothetical protein